MTGTAAGTARTSAATKAQLARFKTPEERSIYFRELGRKSQANRIILTLEDKASILAAYNLLISQHPVPLAESYLRDIADRIRSEGYGGS